MNRTTLTVAIDLHSEAAPIEQRGAAFEALRVMLKMFRRVPFATDGEHTEIFITGVRLADGEPKKPPD